MVRTKVFVFKAGIKMLFEEKILVNFNSEVLLISNIPIRWYKKERLSDKSCYSAIAGRKACKR